jgi:DNA repair photolyase
MASKSVIYQTHGRAAEYCPLAINLYSGCPHGCRYCYAPDVVHREASEFHEPANVKARVTPGDLQRSALQTAGEAFSLREVGRRWPVLLCFVCDPYPPIESENRLTRSAFEILHEYGYPVTVLTKAGVLARRDFDLYREGDSFATTLTFLDERRSREWEPNAASPDERLQNLYLAHQAGIETWVSLEPVIDPHQTIAIIHATYQWTDHYKVGKLNARTEELKGIERGIDWTIFAYDVRKALHQVKRGYYIKRDLSIFMGVEYGNREGKQLPIT